MKKPNSLAIQIVSYVEMILLHLFKPQSAHRREIPSKPVWSPSPEGTAVVHVDVALFSTSSRMGVGVVIR